MKQTPRGGLGIGRPPERDLNCIVDAKVVSGTASMLRAFRATPLART
ncbi:hypothetical protein [Streptomyces sp. NPDC058371]